MTDTIRMREIVEREVERPDDLLTLQEAARRLGWTIQRMARVVNEGHIPCFFNADAPNPQRGARLVRQSDVARLGSPMFVDPEGDHV